MNTIHTWFDAKVQQTPLATAVVFGNQSLTYQALNDRANRLAIQLQELSVTSEKQIALCMERSIEQITAILAILKVGCAYVPLDATHPSERLKLMLAESNALILITTTNYQQQFHDYQGSLIFVDQKPNIGMNANVDNILIPVQPENLAYVIYTSGSTGAPKGVLIEHQSVINYCQWFNEYSGAQSEQRIDWSANYIFDMAVTTSIVSLMLGLTIVMCTDEIKKNTRAYLRYLKTNKINLIKITPGYFKELLREANTNFIQLPNLKTIILGGENLRTADCRAWLELYPEHTLYNEYGPTEATVAVTQQRICKNSLDLFHTDVPIGYTGSNMDCYILNSDNKPVKHGDIGELHIGGVCLARGYINQPELTREKFIHHSLETKQVIRLYKTGDLCRQQDNGVIEYLGRKDQQVKIRGYRVELGEIEQCLSTHPRIDDAVVIAHEDRNSDLRLVAYCILKNKNHTLEYAEIRKYLQQYLADYMIPAAFIPVDFFPLTANGKLDQRALPLPPLTGSQHYQPPRTGLEKKLVKIWEQELGINLIGINDNFYELGGHSLNAARILFEIQQKLGKQITINEFYPVDTIANLAKIIKKTANAPRHPERSEGSPEPRPPKKMPLSDFQLLLWISKTFEPKASKLNIISRKRWQGKLDIDALNVAFEAVIKRHEILSYRIATFYPAQCSQINSRFNVIESTLTTFSQQESEQLLSNSLHQLINFNPWPKYQPLVMARLFYLPDDRVELQLCLPHLIADEVSINILWNDLSAYYQHETQSIEQAKPFSDYILSEQEITEAHFEEDFRFWKNHLNNTQLLSFSPECVESDIQKKGLSYSTYYEIPPQTLSGLEQYCALHHVGLDDVLCAAVSMALKNFGRDNQDTARCVLMNIVKSTRNDPAYDDTIGCFLRVDPIKVNVAGNVGLLSVAEQIHHTLIENTEHMRASSIMKLACMAANNSKLKWNFLIKSFISNYTKVLKLLKLNYKVLLLGSHLAAFDRDACFIIYINLWNNFILSKNKKEESPLFGLKSENIRSYQYDISSFDNVLDVTFLRDESQTPYLVISSNLKSAVREDIAKEIIKVIVGVPLVGTSSLNRAPTRGTPTPDH